MKVFTGSIATESNTTSPIPTGLGAFRDEALFHGREGRLPSVPATEILVRWRDLAEAEGHTVIESIVAWAQPGAPTVRAAWESIKDELLEDLKAAGPVDIVLLSLHGAMVADGVDDCEGDVIGAVRQILGPGAVIGVELDLHCHLTEMMIRNATAIITFKEYPHTDMNERADELYRLCTATALGRCRPVMAFTDCRMIGSYGTTTEPMRGFVRRMTELEGHDGILSVSLAHGFPYADVEDVGARVLIVADGDREKAVRLSNQLAHEFWAMADQLTFPYLHIDQAIERIASEPPGLVVIADLADNAGGGAASDSTFILSRFLERGVSNAALGVFWDPVATQHCHEAGVGATLDLRVGGKCGPASGNPVDLRVRVMGLSADHSQQGLGTERETFGAAAWVRAQGLDMALATRRNQVLAPDAFSGLGIDLASRRIVVVKSNQHFRAHFAPVASSILYVDTPGAVPANFAELKLTKRKMPFWPRWRDPFVAD